MKKWYAPCQLLLMAALAAQLVGCASTSRTIGRWTGKDKPDEQVAKVDDLPSKSDKAAKSKPDGARVADSKSKSAKQTDHQPTKPGDDKLVADARSDRPKAAVKSKETDRSKDSQAVAKSGKPAETVIPSKARTASPFDEIDRVAATAELTDDPFRSFPMDEVAVERQEPFESMAGSVELSAGVLKPKSASGKVAQGTHKLPPITPPPANHAVAQAKAVAGLPDWALEDAPSRPVASEISQTAATALQPGQPAPAEQRLALATTESAEMVPLAAPLSTPKLSALCPTASGEVKELVKALDTRDVESLKRTIHRLGRMQGHAAAAAPALQALLGHSDGFVRVHAALALVRMEALGEDVSQTLIVSLRSPDPGIRSFAAAVLAEMGPNATEALPALSAGLNDSDGYVRLHVAEVLIRHEEWSFAALQSINDSLNSKDENIRWLATYSLAELAPQSEESVLALKRALSDPAAKVQIGAAYALGEIGPLAVSAIPELERCRKSADLELQSAADYAIGQIRP